jgi:filamentous hemagglutinin family protein
MMTTIFKRRLVPLMLAACFGAAVAAPTGQQVVAGQATFSQQGNVFSITNTPGTIINWQSFSINPGEVTRFIQQGADSAVLNRITGQDPSRILGALQSNGKVFLINPNGILFGRDSRVDVNGLVASSLNISNADFLAGKKTFQAGAVAGDVRNEGAITTPAGGQVYLVAPNVSNAGIITSPKGDVVLAAGHSVQLVDSRDPDMQVVVSAPADQAINLGQVVAQGGRIGIYGALVNQRGLVSANSAVVGENGKIVLKASRSAQLEAGSVTSATGAGTGGTVHVLGDRVALTGNAAVDASGKAGGGTVLVGGDWQGKNAALTNATQTVMGSGASIKADALDSGNGGKVVLWSNGSTSAQGSISARGGANGGNGGQVETSGHNLNVDGIKVSAGAAKGKNGDWLLDPYDLQVVAAGTLSAIDAADQNKGPGTGISTVAPSTLTAAGANVQLQALHDITVTDAISAVGTVTASAGNDLKINADITSAGGDIVLHAANSINLASTASLKSNNYVDLIANQMTLAGNIGTASGQKPIITFNPSTDSRYIQVGGTNTNDVLWLDPAALSRFPAYGINIGSSVHTGQILVSDPLSVTGNVIFDSAGSIHINAPVTASGSASNIVVSSHAADPLIVDVAAAITAGNLIQLKADGLRLSAPVQATSVVVAPNNATTSISLGGTTATLGKLSLTEAMINQISAPRLTVGGQAGQVGSTEISGALNVTSSLMKLTIDAGAAGLAINAPLTMPSGLVVLSGGNVTESSVGALNIDQLSFKSGDTLTFNGTNSINAVGGTANNSIVFGTTGALRVGTVNDTTGVQSSAGPVTLTAGGALTLGAGVSALGHNDVKVTAAGITGTGVVSGYGVQLTSYGGIGSTTAPVNTAASSLMLYNTQGSDAKPINVSNIGDVELVAMMQRDPSSGTNAGSLTLRNTGNLTTHASSVDWWSVRSTSGSIDIAATGTVGINGKVTSTSGSIRLASGGDMTVNAGGAVASNSGNLNLTTGANSRFAVMTGASVASTSGDINVSAGSTSIASGTVTAAEGKLHVTNTTTTPPTPPAPPTLDQCSATPTASGCDAILQKARAACSADWSVGHCDQVMPADAVAAHNALLACIANPKGANCGSVLPPVDSCQTKPGQAGCDVVLAERSKIDACLANPTAACFGSTLPSAAVCAAKPDTYGCTAVQTHNSGVLACVANPTSANCASVVLPALAVCQADASIEGCSATLARQKFVSCSADATLAGCASVLPPVSVCKVTPTAEGCGAVIKQTFNSCLAKPNDAVCVGILPSVSQCVADKTAAGCQAVLPTMNQCIGSPTLQGCGVVLPKLELCAVNPNLQGCEAVLPKPDFCSSHPSDPSCRIFDPQPAGGGGDSKTPVSQTVQTTVTLINTSTGKTPAASGGGTSSGSGASTGGTSNSTSSSSSSSSSSDSSSDKQNGPAGSENSGAKNDKPATKTYCN